MCLSAVQGFDLSFGVNEIVTSRGYGITQESQARFDVLQVSPIVPNTLHTPKTRLIGNNFGSHDLQPLLNLPEVSEDSSFLDLHDSQAALNLTDVAPGSFSSCLPRYLDATFKVAEPPITVNSTGVHEEEACKISERSVSPPR